MEVLTDFRAKIERSCVYDQVGFAWYLLNVWVLFESLEYLMCLTFIYFRFCYGQLRVWHILIEEHNVNLSTHRHYQYAYQAFHWLIGDFYLNDLYDSILFWGFIILFTFYIELICKLAYFFIVIILSEVLKVITFIFSFFVLFYDPDLIPISYLIMKLLARNLEIKTNTWRLSSAININFGETLPNESTWQNAQESGFWSDEYNSCVLTKYGNIPALIYFCIPNIDTHSETCKISKSEHDTAFSRKPFSWNKSSIIVLELSWTNKQRTKLGLSCAGASQYIYDSKSCPFFLKCCIECDELPN